MAIVVGRRQFISALGGAAVAWPLTAPAQQAGKLPTIGFLGAATASAWSKWIAAFVQRLHELGWIEDRTIVIEYRWAEGRNERYAEIAADFVRQKVDVIVTSGAAIVAAKQATSVIPIVFGVANDPLSTGLVASLSRPGGNVTGLSLLAPDLAGKRLEFVREIIPSLRKLAIMGNVGYPASVEEMNGTQATAHTMGFEVDTIEIRRADEIAPAVNGLKAHADALYICADPLLLANASQINAWALAEHLPTIHALREFVDANGLMSYGPNFPDLWRRAAEYVDKILRGTKPGDIPVEQPTKFELVINLKTAKALGLTVPPTLLATADDVIE
jgi:ABC-type uncharacterized transport system substrate-binding protein